MRRSKCESNSVDNSQLIGVSLVYVNHDLTTHEQTVDNDKTFNLSTSNYPNYYSVGSDHLWRISGNNKTSKALLTFTDLGLSPGHQLLLRSQKFSDDVTQTLLPNLSDKLVTLPLFMNLTSDSIDATKQPFSGRGFTATLQTYNCGDNLTLEIGKDLPLSLTNLTGLSKCVWMISTNNPNNSAISLIEFNIDDKDLEKNIRIYDSNSIRDNKFLNYTYFNTSRKSSSTNSLIIEYTIDAKNPKPLNLTFKQTGIF